MPPFPLFHHGIEGELVDFQAYFLNPRMTVMVNRSCVRRGRISINDGVINNGLYSHMKCVARTKTKPKRQKHRIKHS